MYYWPASDLNTACLSEIGGSVNNPFAGLVITDTRGFEYWKAPINPYGATVSSDSSDIPPPMALGGPDDPFYKYDDPKVQSYLSKFYPASIVSRFTSSDAHHPAAKISSTLEQKYSLSSRSRQTLYDPPTPGPRPTRSLLSSTESTADLKGRDVSHPITSAVKYQDLPDEAAIGDFT